MARAGGQGRAGRGAGAVLRGLMGGLLCVASLAAAGAGLVLEPLARGLQRPVYLTHAGDARLFVVEQPGRILTLVPGSTQAPAVFLDIRGRVHDGGNEQGLLSVAFHPQFDSNRRLFVNYTGRGGTTVVAEYRASDDGSRALADSERVVLRVEQPYSNHNGGQLKFGPDGYLYIGMGDGGAGGDPLNAGQDRHSLLGAMLRIDVDGTAPYGVPSDNPYARGGGAGEIWAIGLRNPWRFSFDRETGDLYIADVGQNAYEEVNFQPAGSRGGENYGWRVREASHCYDAWTCRSDGLVAPVAEYGHAEGCSVTGGYVYRGQRMPALRGVYVFGDFCSGTVWSLRQQGGGWQRATLADTRLRISSFGEDSAGELYVLGLSGEVMRLGWR